MIVEYMMKSTSIVSIILLDGLSGPTLNEDLAEMCNDSYSSRRFHDAT